MVPGLGGGQGFIRAGTPSISSMSTFNNNNSANGSTKEGREPTRSPGRELAWWEEEEGRTDANGNGDRRAPAGIAEGREPESGEDEVMAGGERGVGGGVGGGGGAVLGVELPRIQALRNAV